MSLYPILLLALIVTMGIAFLSVVTVLMRAVHFYYRRSLHAEREARRLRANNIQLVDGLKHYSSTAVALTQRVQLQEKALLFLAELDDTDPMISPPREY